jgi:hypothetical protein
MNEISPKVFTLLNLLGHRSRATSLPFLFLRPTRFGADAVALINEVWTAPAEALRPYQRPGEVKERGEALALLLASREGPGLRFFAIIQRKGWRGRKVSLGPTQQDDGGAAFVFAPIYRAWGKDIPPEWNTAEDQIMALARKD